MAGGGKYVRALEARRRAAGLREIRVWVPDRAEAVARVRRAAARETAAVLSPPGRPRLDRRTKRALRLFLDRVKADYAVTGAWLFGSRARGDHRPDSDADVAVMLAGEPGRRSAVAMDMGGLTSDVLLETGIVIQAVPLWQADWDGGPGGTASPGLIAAIRRDGVPL